MNELHARANEFGLSRFSSLTSDQMVNVMTEWITAVNDECMKRVKPRGPKGISWWTDELTVAKRETQRCRKRYQNGRRRMLDDLDEIKREWRVSEKKYKRMIHVSKERDWRDLVGRGGNKDPWGTVYKVCHGKSRSVDFAGIRTENGCAMTWMESANVLMQSFFPREREACIRTVDVGGGAGHVSAEYAWGELGTAVDLLRQRKAPGLDGITSTMIKRVWKVIPMYVKCMYDKCLNEGNFPRTWKKARVIPLLKGIDKDRKEPGSYRPISLLNGMGKLLERLMTERMLRRMDGKWNERQFGFRPGRSTEDAWMRLRECVSSAQHKYVLGILVDFKGAFNNLCWNAIFGYLRECG